MVGFSVVAAQQQAIRSHAAFRSCEVSSRNVYGRSLGVHMSPLTELFKWSMALYSRVSLEVADPVLHHLEEASRQPAGRADDTTIVDQYFQYKVSRYLVSGCFVGILFVPNWKRGCWMTMDGGRMILSNCNEQAKRCFTEEKEGYRAWCRCRNSRGRRDVLMLFDTRY